MIEKTRAIVLHFFKFKETQFVVDFLTESHGRLTFLVKMSSKNRGVVKRQYLQSLMLLNLEFDYRPNLRFQKISNVEVACPFADIPFSPMKVSLSLFLAEVLVHATRCDQNNGPLFSFVFDSLVWLDNSKGSVANFHILFLMKLSFYIGVGPNISEASYDRPYFDLVGGEFVPLVPNHSHFLSQAESGILLQLLRLDYNTMHLYKMTRLQRNHCVEVILSYYKIHVPGFPDMKSLSVLRELFG